jgi:3-oxoacyl-[acyl-carrier-protein] synthase II
MDNVAITGQGVISSLGLDIKAFNAGLDACRIEAAPTPWSGEGGVKNNFASTVRGFDPHAWMDERVVNGTDPFAQFAIAAAVQAIESSGLGELDPTRTAVIMGTSMAGANSLLEAQEGYDRDGYEGVPRKLQLMAWPNMAAGHIALRYKLHGPLLTVSTACASSLDAIGLAAQMVESGMVDAAVCGGCDYGGAKVAQLSAVRYGMSPTHVDDPHMVCRPFDKNRVGIIGGEGAGVFVLERRERAEARGATIHGMLRGYASLSDAYHPSSPDPTGDWEVAAMEQAQRAAGLGPEQISALVAHGTGTPVGDTAEIRAINRVFADKGAEVAVTSIKGNVGHTAGAAGVMGIMAGLHSMQKGALVPTASTTDLDEEVRFHVPLQKPTPMDIPAFQVNGFGFGGQDASVVISAA